MMNLLDQLNNEKETYLIKDMGKVVTGKTPSKDHPEDWGDEIDFITPTDFTNDGKYLPEVKRKISAEGKSRYKNMVVPAGSVVVTCIGSDMGKVVIAKNQSLTNQQINTIVVDDKRFDTDFAYYTIKSLYPVLRSVAEEGGSTMPIITKGVFERIEIEAPDLPTQQKIGQILNVYDAKIENNYAIIRNLETTAQTIFNEWFINYRFPGHEKVQMIDGEQGQVPEGWIVKPLDEIANYLNGVASQKFPPKDENKSLPVIKIREMNSGIDADSDRATSEIDQKYIVRDGDVLFSWSGSLVLMIWTGGEGVLNQHIFKVTSENYPKWFYYYWTKRHLQNFQKIAEGKATTMGHIQRHHLTESLVVVPDDNFLEKANSILEGLFDLQISLAIENKALSQQRDRLLERLI